MNPEDIPDESDAELAESGEEKRRPGWPTPGPGRPGPGGMLLRRAYELSLAKWGDPGKQVDRGVGSVRWVQQKLNEEGHGDHPVSTVQKWIKQGQALRQDELSWLLDPIHNREKITNQAHQLIGRVLEEDDSPEGIRDTTKELVALLGGSTGLLRLVADVTGAKAATAIEIGKRMPAGMSEAHVAKLRATDPAAMTDAERRDMRAAYDTRRRNGTDRGGAGSRHADPDHHGPVTQ